MLHNILLYYLRLIENDKENFKTKTLNKVSEWQNDLSTIDIAQTFLESNIISCQETIAKITEFTCH